IDKDSKYLYVNDAYCRDVGKSKEFFYNSSIRELRDDGYLTISIWEVVMKEKAPVPSIITITDQETERIYDVLSIGIPHFDDAGEIDFIFYTQEPIDHINEKLHQSIEINSSSFSSKPKNNIYDQMVAESPQMKSLLDTIDPVIPTDAAILINGPSGSGKEVLANYIIKNSSRSNKPFIVLNCGAIPESLMESELFGYEKGAFTGASSYGKPGVIEMADQGTLFLDEINSMPRSMQTKLLRVLETKRISRIGSGKEKQIDFRLICAANEDLGKMVAEKRFRQDLYYRINVISVNIPPLHERREDIIPLANLFLKKMCVKYNMVKFFDKSVLLAFEKYSWPGNIRELRNVTERMVLTSAKGEVRISEIPSFMLNETPLQQLNVPAGQEPLIIDNSDIDWERNTKTFKDYMYEKEKALLQSALTYYKTPANVAKALKIDLSNVYRKMNKYGL
nr:sigma 54-interacting transcriptional regulator [Solobacterium sp.]